MLCLVDDVASSSAGARWALEEFGNARLGDRRRTRRLVRMAGQLRARMGASLPMVVRGVAEARSAYRFFANPRVDFKAILGMHSERTATRCAKHEFVLAVHDTTSVGLTHHPATQGLGRVSGSKGGRGFHVHSSLAVSPQGVPLGLFGAHIWNRPIEKPQPRLRQRAHLRVDEKESGRWVDGMRCVERALPTKSRVVHVMDREGDMYEVFMEASRLGHDLLVRSCHNRRVKDSPHLLWDLEDEAPLAGVVDVAVPRAAGRPSRVARLSVRFVRALVRAPTDRTRHPDAMMPFTVNVVFAREENPPSHGEPIHWRLVTTLPVTTLKDAVGVIEMYRWRWRVEDYHRTLKSGCRVEHHQLEEADHHHRAVALCAAVAASVETLKHESRANGDQPATHILTPREMEVLRVTAQSAHWKTPAGAWTLRDAVLVIARLGGFLARKRDGEPGSTVLWRGWAVLADRVAFHEALERDRPNDDGRGE